MAVPDDSISLTSTYKKQSYKPHTTCRKLPALVISKISTYSRRRNVRRSSMKSFGMTTFPIQTLSCNICNPIYLNVSRNQSRLRLSFSGTSNATITKLLLAVARYECSGRAFYWRSFRAINFCMPFRVSCNILPWSLFWSVMSPSCFSHAIAL